MIDLTILDDGGEQIVHATGCSDIGKAKGPAWTGSYASRGDVALDIWADFTEDVSEALAMTTFKPCTKGLA